MRLSSSSSSVYKQCSGEGDEKDACLTMYTFTVESEVIPLQSELWADFNNTESKTRLPCPGFMAPGSVSDSPPVPVSVDLPPGLLLWALMQVSETPGRARSGPLLGTRSRGLDSFLPHFLHPSRTLLLFSTLPLITIIVIIDLKNYCC